MDNVGKMTIVQRNNKKQVTTSKEIQTEQQRQQRQYLYTCEILRICFVYTRRTPQLLSVYIYIYIYILKKCIHSYISIYMRMYVYIF